MAFLQYKEAEILISEVRKRPCIWDSSTEEYKDKKKKMQSWVEICRLLYPQYETYKNEDKVQLVRESQARWRNIRDSYSKDCRRIKSEMEGTAPKQKKRRPYIFSDHLKFLKKVIDKKETPQNPPEKMAGNVDEISALDGNPEEQDESLDFAKKRKLSIERLLKITGKAQEAIDPDKDFFMSMLPSVWALSEEQRLEFRMQVLNILQTIKAGGFGAQNSNSAFPIDSQFQQFPHYLLSQSMHSRSSSPEGAAASPGSPASSNDTSGWQEENTDEINIKEESTQQETSDEKRNVQIFLPVNGDEENSKKTDSNDAPTRVEEPITILKSGGNDSCISSDECAVYGQHVANKLRKYGDKTRAVVQHFVNNTLFSADMGQFDMHGASVLGSNPNTSTL